MTQVHLDFEEGVDQAGWRKFLRLRVVLGAALLLAVNALLLAWSPLSKVDPDSLPAAHTWVWWATREFLAEKPAPNVVLLGSSLVMHPISRQDADFLKQDIDYVKHHRSNYMEHELQERGVKNSTCYNFALPGGMISDDYMVARAFFKTRKPQVVVLGLSIRDFIDNGVHSAGGTPAFRYLKRFTDVDDLVDVAMPQLWQRCDFVCGKGLYLWGKKLDLQVLLAEKAKQVLAPAYEHIFSPSLLAQADPSRNQPSNQRAEVEAGMMIVKHDEPYSYDDNSAEYKRRYRSTNEKGVAVQKCFFDKLLQLTRQQGIKVVLLNMPLTQANHNLMPPGSYDQYLSILSSAAKQYGCDFIDLDSQGHFTLSDYYDTAHMNAQGGKKLVDLLALHLTEGAESLALLKQVTGNAKAKVASQGNPY